MSKTRHRKRFDFEDFGDYDYDRSNKFRNRRARRWKKIREHDENLPSNENPYSYKQPATYFHT